MSTIADWLVGSLSQDPTLIRESTRHLEEAYQQNFPGYISELAKEHLNLAGAQNIRLAAGIALKNALIAKDSAFSAEKASLWAKVDDSQKSALKLAILDNLDSNVGAQSALVIDAIASIELPRNGWPDLIEILLLKVTSSFSSELLKSNAIVTLSYICESVDPSVMQPRSDQILTAVINGARKEESERVRKLSFDALYHSLLFVRENFLRQNERDMIMTVVCEGCRWNPNEPQNSSMVVQVAAFQCLIRIVELYYELMPPYMTALYYITLMSMKAPSEELVLQAIEFWSALCEKEFELLLAEADATELGLLPKVKCMNYARDVLSELVVAIFGLLATQSEDVDEDEWYPAMAASSCMCLLAQCSGMDILTHALPLIEQYIKDTDWHKREAAIMTFGCIFEGPDAAMLARLTVNAFDFITTATGDQLPIVRDTAQWTLGRICEFAIERLEPQYQQHIVAKLLCGLNDEPRIVATSCLGLLNFAEHVAPNAEGESTCGTSLMFSQVVRALLQLAQRNDNECNMRTSAYATLASWIMASATDSLDTVRETAAFVLSTFRTTFSVPVHSINYGLASSLFFVLNALIRRLHFDVRTSPEEIVNLLTTTIQLAENPDAAANSSNIKEDVLMCLGSLACALQDDFARYSDRFIGFVTSAIGSFEEPTLSLAGVGVVSDFCKVLDKNFINYAEPIMFSLGNTLTNQNASVSVKPHILTCFGDIALAIGSDAMINYLGAIMKILEQAQTASENLPADSEYADQLREAIIEALAGIVNTFSIAGKIQVLLPYLKFLESVLYQATITVAKMTATSSAPERLFNDIAGILGDLACSLGPDNWHMLCLPWPKAFLLSIVGANSVSERTWRTAKWALDKINILTR